MLATVRGDVHDIGKNLVDIILSNNGYTVVNIGIKQPISEILRAAAESDADVIGMSGLLVKSTVVMKENLEEINTRGDAARWPVILGGAALTRAYVENDLAELYAGDVRYARDAFEGLRLMDALVAVKRGVPGAELPALRPRRVRSTTPAAARPGRGRRRFGGHAAVRRRAGADGADPAVLGRTDRQGHRPGRLCGLPRRAGHLRRPVGPEGVTGRFGPSYEELVETEGRPRLRMWLERVQTEGILEAAVVSGYYPCVSEGNDLVVLHHEESAAAAGVGAAASGPASPSRGSAATAGCAWRTSSAPGRRPSSSAGRRHRLPAGDDGLEGRRGDGGAVRCQRLSRLPRAARAVGAAHRGARRVLARAGARRAGVRGRGRRGPGRRSCARATAVRATPSATRPAPSWRTGPRWSRCCVRSGSGSSSPRSCSCTPSSRPTRSWCTTPRPSTSTPPEPRET